MRRLLLPLGCAALFTACAAEEEAAPGAASVITDVSASSVVIGETLEFFGEGFVPEDRLTDPDAELQVHLRGTFAARDGERVPVDLHLPAAFNAIDARHQILTVRRFGPYANPFTGDARLGRFEGKASVVRETDEGLVSEGKATSMTLDVEPSILIESFEPIEAECGAPAVRALAGMPYHMRVRVAGLKAVSFKYELSGVNANDGVTTVVHGPYGSPTDFDELGIDEAVLFNPVPEDMQSYISAVRVIARDANGATVETALPVPVHRPIEVRYGGTYELAEVYEPEPVSGCIPGSIGSAVEYSETHTETRQQSVSLTVSSNWRRQSGTTVSETLREGITVGESRSNSLGGSEWEGEQSQETYGVSYNRSEANNMSYSSRDGESWSWNVNEGESNEDYESRMNMVFGEGSWSGTVGVSGEGSIPGFAKVSGRAETTVGVRVGASTQGTTGTRNRVSVDTGYGMSGNHDETQSFGSTVGESQGGSLSGSYALTQSRQRSFNDTESRQDSRSWNLSDGVSASEAVSEGMSEVEARTWVTSESLATRQSLRGFIPRTKVGIFYRQTSRWVRRAEVRTYDLCGLANHAGELQFNEWTWAAELAIGDDCSSEPPASELPEAQCYISPCGG